MASDYVPIEVSTEEFVSLFEKGELELHEELPARDYALGFFKKIQQDISPKDGVFMSDIIRQQTDETLAQLFWGLELCSCCWRHFHKRPKSLCSKKVTSALKVATLEMIENGPECHCCCRQFMRDINREMCKRY